MDSTVFQGIKPTMKPVYLCDCGRVFPQGKYGEFCPECGVCIEKCHLSVGDKKTDESIDHHERLHRIVRSKSK